MNSPLDHPAFRTTNGFCSITPDALIFTSRIADDSSDGSSPTFPDATETTAIIDRADIISVTAHEPDPPRDRGSIVVLYNRDDVTRQRTITLEEKTGDGFEEFEGAMEAFFDGGIQVDTDSAQTQESGNFVFDHPTFRTKEGFCSITPDEIVFTRPVGLDSLEPLVRTGHSSRVYMAVFAAMIIVLGILQIDKELVISGLGSLAVGALLIGSIFKRRAPEPITPVETTISSSIVRADVVSVSALESDPPRTRGSIIFRYTHDGTMRTKTIELDHFFGDKDEELVQAVGVLRKAGLKIKREATPGTLE